MATAPLPPSKAAATLKQITGQASLANALSRAAQMHPQQLGQYGITPDVLRQLQLSGTPVDIQGTATNDRGSDPAYITAHQAVMPSPSLVGPRSISSFLQSPQSFDTNKTYGSSIGSSPATNYQSFDTNKTYSKPFGANAGQTLNNAVIAYGQSQDRGSDPAYIAAHQPVAAPPDVLDRGSDPAFKAAHPVNPGGPIKGASGNASPAASAIPGLITKMPTVAIPNAPNIHIAWHDFTPQANAKVAGAYAPLYTALAGAKTNASHQNDVAQASIKGMYDNLDKASTAATAATGARYNTAANQATTLGNQQVAGIKDAYKSSANDLASLLSSTGVGGAQGNFGAQTLGETFGHSADAQAAAKAAAAENYANTQAQGRDEQNYITNMAGADRSQALADRATLNNQLGNVLQQYDNQGLATRAQQAQQGLQLNQQMGQNDFGAQTASANQTNQQFSDAMAKANFQQSSNMASIGLQNQGILNEQQRAAAQVAAAQQAAIAQMNYNAAIYKQNVNLAGQQNDLNIAIGKQDSANVNSEADRQSRERIANLNAQLKNPNSPINLLNNNPQQKYLATLQAVTGDPAAAVKLKGLVDKAVKNIPATSGGKPTFVEFQKAMEDAAVAAGLTADEGAAAAYAYQDSMNNRAFVYSDPSIAAQTQAGVINPLG